MSFIKIFHYEPFYNFYLSTERHQLQPGVGLPAHSTDIIPPLLICAEGYIPVFKDTKWVIEKDDFWRPVYQVVTYNSIFPLGCYEPIQVSLFSGDFPTYPNLPQICNSNLVCMLIGQKIRAAQEKYQEAVDYYSAIFDTNELYRVPVDGTKEACSQFTTSPSAIYKYHFLVEEMVMYMRSTIDNLVQLAYVLTNFDEYIETMRVKQDKIGKLGTTEEAESDLEKIFIGDGCLYEKDPSSIRFLWVINQLSNSMKHSMMHAEAYNQLGNSCPTIVSYFADYNDHKKVIMNHQHDLEQIMLGFQSTVLRILKNQKIYAAQI